MRFLECKILYATRVEFILKTSLELLRIHVRATSIIFDIITLE